jgi:serine/threonine protein kinase
MEADPGFARTALSAGARGYVLEDAAEAELVEAVRSVLAGGTYLDPSLGARLARMPPEPSGTHPGLSHGEPDLAVGTDFAGHRIDGFVGQGGMGIVFRATDLALGRTVALKVIAPDAAGNPIFRARFELESRVAAAFEHPHVVQIYHAGQDEGLLYLTMRYVDGADVDARADIYSLACILFQMLTGSVVFDREGDLEKLWAHVHDPPRRLVALNPELPPGLQDVLDRALAKNPGDRQQSATQLAQDATAALGHG